MNIDWNHVTKFSQTIAIILFVGVFAFGFWLGKDYEYHAFVNSLNAAQDAATVPANEKIISDVTYGCDADKTIRAIYRNESVELLLSDGRHFSLPHAVSGSGARYANQDEAIVFWNKGTTAFITEASGTTFANCNQTPKTTSP